MTQPPSPNPHPSEHGQPRSIRRRMGKDVAFRLLCIAAAALAILTLLTLLVSVSLKGWRYLSWDLLTSMTRSDARQTGVLPAVTGTILVCLVCALAAIPLGVGTAILLEEFKPVQARGKQNMPLVRWLITLPAVVVLIVVGNGTLAGLAVFPPLRVPLLVVLGVIGLGAGLKFIGGVSIRRFSHAFIQTNLTNLAGVPSIVYGILGVTAFANMFGLFGPARESTLTVGQDVYHMYQDLEGRSYYVPVENVKTTKRPADEVQAFYTQPGGKQRAQLTVVAKQREQAKIRLTHELLHFQGTLRKQISQTRRGERNSGPAQIDHATAARIAKTALARVHLKIDRQQSQRKLTAKIRALNGMDGLDLTYARMDAQKLIADAELQRRFEGQIYAQAMPTVYAQQSPWFLRLPLGRSVLAGGLTLMLVILPIIIVSAQESIRAVPDSMRRGAFALGATRWQTISKMSLPAAIPGMCTGTILAMSRAIGEAAPILMLAGGTVFVSYNADNLMSQFTNLPLLIYNWTGKPQDIWREVAASAIIILLVVLFVFNLIAVFIRQKFQKKLS